MNEYAIKTEGRAITLQWFAETAQDARREAEAAGHKVKRVRIVREITPDACPGVVCKCPADFCPAHGKLDRSELKKGRRVRG